MPVRALGGIPSRTIIWEFMRIFGIIWIKGVVELTHVCVCDRLYIHISGAKRSESGRRTEIEQASMIGMTEARVYACVYGTRWTEKRILYSNRRNRWQMMNHYMAFLIIPKHSRAMDAIDGNEGQLFLSLSLFTLFADREEESIRIYPRSRVWETFEESSRALVKRAYKRDNIYDDVIICLRWDWCQRFRERRRERYRKKERCVFKTHYHYNLIGWSACFFCFLFSRGYILCARARSESISNFSLATDDSRFAPQYNG